MDKLGKLGKRLQGKKGTNANNNSGGQSLQTVVKEATAKTLRRPDAELNQQVVDLIGSAVHNEGPREVARVLTDRLALKNPHKVWLAVELIREVLSKCGHELAPVRDDIMAEVRKVASDAMKRFNSNLADQQRAKAAAFDLLRTYGHDGHILSQPHLENQAGRAQQFSAVQPGTPGRGGGHSSWPALAEAVQTQTAVAVSHNDLLQDMLLDTTPLPQRTPEQRALAEEVILEAKKFRAGFEQLLAQLGAHDTPQANELLATGLAKIDLLNASLTQHKEALKKQLREIPGGAAAAAAAASPKSPAAFQPPSSKPAADPGLGGLLELQQGLDAANRPPQQPAADPFQASSQWQQPPPPPQHQQPGQGQGQGQQGWGSQPPPANPFTSAPPPGPGFGHPPMHSHPGYGYGGYSGGYGGYGYGGYPGYGPPPPQQHAYGGPPPQGYGPPGQQQPQQQPQQQHQQWYPPSPGYGYGQPYPPQFGGQQPQQQPPPQQQQQQQRLQQQGSQGHVPPPMSEAFLSPPEKRQPPASPGSAAAAPAGKAPLQPPTPPAAAAAPAGVSGASPTPSPEASPLKPTASADARPAMEPAPAAAAPDASAAPTLAGLAPANGSSAAAAAAANGGAGKAAEPADDWDLFFTERVSGKQAGGQTAAGDSLAAPFSQLSTQQQQAGK